MNTNLMHAVLDYYVGDPSVKHFLEDHDEAVDYDDVCDILDFFYNTLVEVIDARESGP